MRHNVHRRTRLAQRRGPRIGDGPRGVRLARLETAKLTIKKISGIRRNRHDPADFPRFFLPSASAERTVEKLACLLSFNHLLARFGSGERRMHPDPVTWSTHERAVR